MGPQTKGGNVNGPSVIPMPKPVQPPMTAGNRAMRRDPAFPDAAPDSDVLSLLVGPVQALREQSEWLAKLLNKHREIDLELWWKLSRIHAAVIESSDEVLCHPCLRAGRVTLGRGNGLDEPACDDCIADQMGWAR